MTTHQQHVLVTVLRCLFVLVSSSCEVAARMIEIICIDISPKKERGTPAKRTREDKERKEATASVNVRCVLAG